MKTTLFVLLCCMILPLQAQIIGTVTNNENQPVEYVNVALYALPDTLFITGAVTDSLGHYHIPALNLEESLLRATMVGYKNGEVVINDATQPLIQHFLLEPDERMLQELVVEGERPVLKAEAGKLIYHIAPLVHNKPVTNAYEALREIPGVMERDEQLTLIGTSGMTILLNGQKSSLSYEQLMNLLRSIPLSRVEDVEIMYNAPPQYNIRGAAINVILRQEMDEATTPTWQGELSSGYSRRTHGSENGRANISYAGKATTLDVLYGFARYKIASREELQADHRLQEESYRIDQLSEGVSRIRNHNLRLAADHRLHNDDGISLSYTGQFGKNSSDQLARTVISGTPVGSDIATSGPNTLHNIKGDYQSHRGFKAGVEQSWYRSRSHYTFRNTDDASAGSDPFDLQSIGSASSQFIRRTYFYANQTHSLKGGWQLNYGMHYVLARTSNSSEAEKNEEDYEEATFQNKQKEDIWNLFAGFTKSFTPALSLQASLAAEHYKSRETSGGREQLLWNNLAWFPTLNLSYTASASHILQFELSSNKTYPPYWSLNPSVHHFGAYGVAFGNPQLRPMDSYNAGITWIIRQKYVIRPFFSHVTDYYTQLPYQSPDHLRQEFVMQNFDFHQQAGLMAVLPFNLGKRISSRLVANGIYLREKDESFYDIPFDRETLYGVLQLNSDLRLTDQPNLKMNISGYWATPGAIQGIYDLGGSGDLSAGITWTFNNDRARLVLKGEDLLKTRTPNATINYKGQKSSLDVTRDSRTLSLTFVYRFGGYKEKEREEPDTSRFGM